MEDMRSLDRIRFIVSDMDGTLLDSRGQLPAGLFQAVECLKELGIIFAIASGRSYPTLAWQFEDCPCDITYICENGANIVKEKKKIFTHGMDRQQTMFLDRFCSEIEGIYLIFSGPDHAYVKDQTPDQIKKFIDHYYKSVICVPDAGDIPEPVCKLTIYDPIDAETHSIPRLKELKSPFRISLDGHIWANITLEGTGKEKGVAFIQGKYGISEEETMIFGDYLNDREMLKKAYYSCAMANSHPDILQECRFHIPSNDEQGVMQVLDRVLAARGVRRA